MVLIYAFLLKAFVEASNFQTKGRPFSCSQCVHGATQSAPLFVFFAQFPGQAKDEIDDI